jgi:chemotaxis protein MotA
VDFATIGGFAVAMAMIMLGAILEHVQAGSMIGPSAFLIVVGGSAGATIMSHTLDELKLFPRVTLMAIKPTRLDYPGMIDYLVGLADKARRNGLLALQEDADNARNPLIKRGLTMAVDGSDPEQVLEALDAMLEMEKEEKLQAAMIWETCGGYSPTIGILGTVMGLVTIMGNLSEPDKLGGHIAVAFLATLYGVFFANLIFLPLGAKIKGAVKQEARFHEMLLQGIIGLQSGDNPRNLREKLSIYAPQGRGKRAKAGTAQAAQEGL